MSSLLKDLQEYNTQDPLMDFTDVMFGNDNPQTITQAGLDADAEKLRLNFDGTKLRLMRGDDELDWWPAVSGRRGYWGKEYQNVRNAGPLPEGNYTVSQSNFQNRLDEPLYKRALSYFPFKKFTKYPFGEVKWGNSRIALVPSKDTETFGRNGFFIHGGNRHESAGCIDTARYNDDFMKTFLMFGEDLPLEVSYPEKAGDFYSVKQKSNKTESPETLLSIIAKIAGQD